MRIIVDAGHGGRDGGAVSVTGTPEKTLNLESFAHARRAFCVPSVSKSSKRELPTRLYRRRGPKGSRKMSDLKARLNIALANPDAPLVQHTT